MNKRNNKNYTVILSSLVSHYKYAAIASQQANCLKLYICSIGFRNEETKVYQLLPGSIKKKVNGRDISKLRPTLIKEVWFPELLQKLLLKIGIISPDQVYKLTDNLFDLLARFWVSKSDVFHFVSGVGLFSARKAKANGSILVCDVRTVFPEYQYKIETEEFKILHLPYLPQGKGNYTKILAEFKFADCLIVPSTFAKKTFVAEGFDSRTIYVVPYGVDLEYFFARQESSDGSGNNTNLVQDKCFRILFVGRITPSKGVQYLIGAFNQLNYLNAELILAGPVDEAMEPIISRALQENPKIKAVGKLSKSELFELYNSGSVFVLPSLVDSWGLVVLEAMACKLPVIVTENTGSNEAVEEGKNGFIIPIRDVESLREKLVYLYQHPDIRQKMGQFSQQLAKSFTWQKYGENLIKAYSDIINQSRNQ